SEAVYRRVRDAVNAALVDSLFACVSLVARILTKSREVERGICSQNSLALLGPLNDIRSRLSGLIRPGCISQTGARRLRLLRRDVVGVVVLLKELGMEPCMRRALIAGQERQAKALEDDGGGVPHENEASAGLVEVRWLLVGYRISVFAQRLGTAQTVSPQR